MQTLSVMRLRCRLFFGILILGITACRSLPAPDAALLTPTAVVTGQPTSWAADPVPMAAVPVLLIPLIGPIHHPEAEISGLAWDDDTLLLLPQYPERFTLTTAKDSDGAIFAISKAEILAFLDGKMNTPLNPRQIPIYAPGLKQKISGYQGFESMHAAGQRIFFTIETSQAGGMVGILLAGKFNDDHTEIHIEPGRLVNISAQAQLANFSDEAITLVNKLILTLYEANGAQINSTPVAHIFDLDLNPQGVVLTPNLEYRVTDATQADEQGRFWVMNYFFPGDTKISAAVDPIQQKYGSPPGQKQSEIIERLVQFQWRENQIILCKRPPIYLQILPDKTARNWEGLVQLDERGFLLATDKYPDTLLGFVPFP